MCCGGSVCMLCTCLILVVMLIGLLFGFGVFSHGFHEVKNTFTECDPRNFNATLYRSTSAGRPFFGHAAPPPA